MPSEPIFRFSLYLTLGLACVCVGYAEHDIFPEVPYLAGLVVVALVVLYRLEGRYELLTIPEANRLGLLIGISNLIWAAYRLVWEVRRETSESSDVQLVLVAVVGPLLITSVVAKLARREKHLGDYWGFHAAGLAAVALSGALAEDPTCFLLASFYAVAATWSLTLLQLRRAAGFVPGIPNRPAPPVVSGIITPASARTVVPALTLAATAAALAFPLYFLTPRSGADKLSLGKPRVEIGYAADQMIDLRRTGNLEANPAPAFFVEAEIDGRPKTDLPRDQRWRGRVLRSYENGTWQTGDHPLPGIDARPRNPPDWRPPRLGENQTLLTFTVPARERSQFLADPVAWADHQPSPVATVTPSGLEPWFWVGDGSLYWGGRMPTFAENLRYVQAWLADSDPDLSPPFRITEPDLAGKLRPLLRNPVPAVKTYTDRVIADLMRDGRLPADCLDGRTFLPKKIYHEQVARALSHHLSTTPELVYTTNLRRSRTDLDPVEDFLLHTRAGHCERFSSALTLMLRSQGIPAVRVLGFKGCEPTEQPGRYVVRQEHAHAWVDALIEVYRPAPAPGQPPISRWLSLDPTPAGQVTAPTDADGWLGRVRSGARNLFRDYFVSFDPARRRVLLTAVWDRLKRWEVVAALVVLAASPWFVTRLRRWIRRQADSSVATNREAQWLSRLKNVLAAHGLRAEPGQTPRELALSAGERLRNFPATAAVAGVPLEWVDAYYEERFGGVPLSPRRRAELEARLRELARALAS
jgi:hypothetical protein